MEFLKLFLLDCIGHPDSLCLSYSKVDRKMEKWCAIPNLHWKWKGRRFFFFFFFLFCPSFVSISTTAICFILRPTLMLPCADLIKGDIIVCLLWSVCVISDLIKYFQWYPPSVRTFWWLQTSFPARNHMNFYSLQLYLCYTQ